MNTKPQKERKLSKKQRGFIKDYIETGSGVQAALNNYDTDDYKTANAIAVENLQKPLIAKALADAFTDDFLTGKHKDLFEQKRIDYFVFPKSMGDEEIVKHVASVGITVITVRETDKGKMAFYSITDAQALKGALEFGYKLKGSFAPEKSVTLTMTVDANDPEKIRLAQEYEERLKQQV